MKSSLLINGFVLLLGLSAIASAEKQGSLASCQHIQDQINRYTDLKRTGGSAQLMARWHQRRNDYKEQFSANHCMRYRNKLK